jgi:hypothetical protein
MLPPGPEGDVMLMDVLLIATGCTGALTLLWLARVVARLFLPPAGAVAYFAPGSAPVDALVREMGAARREVLLMAGALACRPIAQALVDARLRQVQVEALLDARAENDPESDLHFLVEQGLVPLLASEPSGLGGLIVLIDGKIVVGSSGCTGGAELSAGEVLFVRGHADLVASCRERFAALRGSARAVGGMAAPVPSTPPPDVKEEPAPAAPPQADAQDVLDAVARGLTTQNESPDAGDGEREELDSSGATVTRATAELFANLRKEIAATEQDDSTEKAA